MLAYARCCGSHQHHIIMVRYNNNNKYNNIIIMGVDKSNCITNQIVKSNCIMCVTRLNGKKQSQKGGSLLCVALVR